MSELRSPGIFCCWCSDDPGQLLCLESCARVEMGTRPCPAGSGHMLSGYPELCGSAGIRAQTLFSKKPKNPAVSGRTRATSTSASRTSAWPRCGATAQPRWRSFRTSCPSCAKRCGRSHQLTSAQQQACSGVVHASLQCSPVGCKSSERNQSDNIQSSCRCHRHDAGLATLPNVQASASTGCAVGWRAHLLAASAGLATWGGFAPTSVIPSLQVALARGALDPLAVLAGFKEFMVRV